MLFSSISELCLTSWLEALVAVLCYRVSEEHRLTLAVQLLPDA